MIKCWICEKNEAIKQWYNWPMKLCEPCYDKAVIKYMLSRINGYYGTTIYWISWLHFLLHYPDEPGPNYMRM